MQRRTTLVFTLAIALAIVLTAVGADATEAGRPAAPEAPLTGAPTVVSYQGQVTVAGTPYTGDGYFKFAVVDAAGATTSWSNDGTSTGGSEPTNAVQLSVSNGLFYVLLGDTALANMTALPASAFAGTERYLRVWFSDGSGFTLLSPDRRIAAVPYALQAEEAKNADLLDGLHASAFQQRYGGVKVVAKSGGDYTTVSAALASITDASDTNRYLVKVMPGVYSEQVTMKPYVDIEGSGELTTKITYTGSNIETGTVVGANYAELRFITAENTGGSYIAAAIYNYSASPRLTHLTAIASGGTGINLGVFNQFSSPTMTDVIASACGGMSSTDGNYAVFNESSSPTMTYVTATASGGRYNVGVFNDSSEPKIQNSTIGASGGTNNYGIWSGAAIGAYTVFVNNSQVSGTTKSLYLEGNVTVRVGASQLSGPVLGGTVTYAGSYDGNFTLNGNQTFSGIPAFNGGVSGSTSPFTVNSNTLVSTLNADLLDGQHGAYYRDAGSLNAGTVATDRYSAYGDLGAEGYLGDAAGDLARNNAALQATLNADLVDGKHALEAGDPLRRASPPQANTATAVDTGAGVGSESSITIGADGLPVVSYRDDTNSDLKVLHCGNAACTTGNTLTAVDTNGDVGNDSSITIGVDGLPVVSYRWWSNKILKVLRCGNAACTAGNSVTLADTGSDVGYDSSITIGADGLPVVSYRGTGLLKVLHCGNAACTAGNTVTVVDPAVFGYHTSITIGADGLPVVSCWDGTNADLTVLHCGDAACTAGNTVTAVDTGGDVGRYTSLTIGADGLPVVSYYDNTNGDLKVLHCGDAACTSGNTATAVDTGGNVGWDSSITVGADGLPVVSYWDNTNGNLKVLHCGDAACTAGNSATAADTGGDVGRHTSLTIGTDGLPVVSYRDTTNGDLKVLHCANAFCTPYFRRR